MIVALAVRTAVFLGSSAIGLLVASILLPDMNLRASGFITAVVVFAVVQSVLSPFVAKLAAGKAPAFLGGTGLIATFVGLAAAALLGGLSVSGWRPWLLASLVVWLVTAIASMLLPLVVRRFNAAERA
jgi:hypothetical protein